MKYKNEEIDSKINVKIVLRMEQAIKEMLRPPPVYMDNSSMTVSVVQSPTLSPREILREKASTRRMAVVHTVEVSDKKEKSLLKESKEILRKNPS